MTQHTPQKGAELFNRRVGLLEMLYIRLYGDNDQLPILLVSIPLPKGICAMAKTDCSDLCIKAVRSNYLYRLIKVKY